MGTDRDHYLGIQKDQLLKKSVAGQKDFWTFQSDLMRNCNKKTSMYFLSEAN